MTKDPLRASISRTVALAVAKLASSRLDVAGVRVYAWPEDDANATRILEKIKAALLLLRDVDAVRFRRFSDGFDSVLAFEANNGTAASTDSRRRTCMLSAKWVAGEQVSIEHLASVLAHEGTHTLIDRAGIEFREGVRSRIEGICLSAEIAFLRKLPVWRADLARVVHAQRGFGESYFCDANLRERRIENLKERGMSESELKLLKLLTGFGANRNGT